MAMSPGRLDQVLYPYFVADVKQNGLTVEEALEISCCLWLKLADNVKVRVSRRAIAGLEETEDERGN